jgi:riboflavin biosynthesis pyrimidine reductase
LQVVFNSIAMQPSGQSATLSTREYTQPRRVTINAVEVIPGRTRAMLEFARIWQAAGKIVYSKSRETVSTPKTRLEREFHPQAVREWKAQSPLDLSVAGPALAAQAIRAGLVDEYHLLVVPTMLGGGIRVVPSNVRIKLDLLEERRFGNGMVYLRYHAQA